LTSTTQTKMFVLPKLFVCVVDVKVSASSTHHFNGSPNVTGNDVISGYFELHIK